MDLAFYKLHSTGGDYLLCSYLQESETDLSLFPGLSRLICRRRSGVGANGLVVLTKGIEHPIRLSYYPARNTGTKTIPGDALACVGRYAFNLGLAENSRIAAETKTGAVTIEAIDSQNFRIDLGVPSDPVSGERISPSSDTDILATTDAGGQRLPFSPITLRSSYAVVITDSRPSAVKKLAIQLADSGDLSGFQPVFMRSISQELCAGYSWAKETTPDHTESMGACAAVGILNGFCDNEVSVRFRSYILHVQWIPSDGRLYVTVPTEYICAGSYSVEDDVLERARGIASE